MRKCPRNAPGMPNTCTMPLPSHGCLGQGMGEREEQRCPQQDVDFGTFLMLNEKGRPTDTKCVRALGSEGRPWTLRRTFRRSRR